jgi:hypothetical protein
MTAVEWLWQITHEREIDKFDWEQALEMEKQQMATNSSQLEISDEEIEKAAELLGNNLFGSFFISGAKWYRKQLKQRNGG